MNLREFVDGWIAAFNRRDGLEDYLAHYGDTVTVYGYPPGVQGKEGLREFYAQVRAAIPDWHLVADDVICEDNRVAVRYRLSGTHQGELLGIPATARTITISGQTIAHLRDGKVVERWQAMDEAGLSRQLQG